MLPGIGTGSSVLDSTTGMGMCVGPGIADSTTDLGKCGLSSIFISKMIRLQCFGTGFFQLIE